MVLTIKIDAKSQTFLDAQIKAKRFSDADAAVNEALALLERREQRVAELRGLIAEADASGAPIPAQDVFAQVRQTIDAAGRGALKK
jgi:putative addiction module CopG family antidote